MPLDRVPVAAGDRSGELEARVHDSADQRIERLGRSPSRLEQRLRRGSEGDEVVRGHRGACVVGGASVVVEVERTQAEGLGEAASGRTSLLVLGAHGTPDAVELLGSEVLGERLQRMQAEAADVWVEGVERGGTADVRDPGAERRPGGDLRDGAVGNTEQDELRRGRVEHDASLCEPRAQR